MLTDVLKTHRLCICVLFCHFTNIVKYFYFSFLYLKGRVMTKKW